MVDKLRSGYFRGVCMGFALGIMLFLAAREVVANGFADSWPVVLGAVGVAAAVALGMRRA